MIVKGQMKNLDVDIYTRKPVVLLELEAKPEELEKLQGKTLSVELKQFREKRSLDANAYYWTLVSKLAEVLEQSNNWVHNYLLGKYGEIEVIDGQGVYLILPDSETAQKTAEQAEMYHLKPTSQVKPGKDGRMYRTYMMLRGSSSFDTKEMSRLINGLVSECKELGIETMTPDEIKRMMSTYSEKHNTG